MSLIKKKLKMHQKSSTHGISLSPQMNITFHNFNIENQWEPKPFLIFWSNFDKKCGLNFVQIHR